MTVKPQSKRNQIDGVRLHWRELKASDVQDDYTTPVMTVVLCLRDLSLREALSVGDSALRSGRVTRAELRDRLTTLRGGWNMTCSQVKRSVVLGEASSTVARTIASSFLALGLASRRAFVAA